MKTYPLKSLSLEEAIQKQFSLVDEITKEFRGTDILTRGDLGVKSPLNQPLTTNKVEKVLAKFFNAESAILVPGAGTNAIRMALYATLPKQGTLLVHKAPIYPTTLTSIDMLCLNIVYADFNDLNNLKGVLNNNFIDGALIQYTRRAPDDSYEIKDIIKICLEYNLTIVTDDNYAALKVSKIGSELGASLSCFSCFKLLGPVGIGCIVGEEKYISKIRKSHYSGGLQIQGDQAIDVLKGMIYAPVSLAISATVVEEVVKRLNKNEIKGVKKAFVANAQSKVIIVELEEEIANEVLIEAEKLGAAPHPVGAESMYEFVPMFYRVSATFRNSDVSIEKRMIRINPLRASANTVLNILKCSLEEVL